MNISLALIDIAAYHPGMTAQQFAATQAKIGCSGVQLAAWLGVRPLTITRYRTGKVAVPGPVALSMKALVDGWRP